MNLPFKTVQDLVLELGKSHFKGFNALPYNRFSDSGIASSERWWLSPTKDNPAFAFGKIVATTLEEWVEAGKVFVGFNVEKGILEPFIKGEDYVLKQHWLWNEFVRDGGSRLEPKLGEAADALGRNVQIVISSGTEPQRGGDVEPGDLVQFEVKGPDLVKTTATIRRGYLKEVATAISCKTLGAELVKLNPPALRYQWVDLMIGSHFEMKLGGANDLGAAAAMLEPFRAWMRAAS